MTPLERLRTACHQAVADLLSDGPDVAVVVGGAAHTAQYPPDVPGSLRAVLFEVTYLVARWRRR